MKKHSKNLVFSLLFAAVVFSCDRLEKSKRTGNAGGSTSESSDTTEDSSNSTGKTKFAGETCRVTSPNDCPDCPCRFCQKYEYHEDAKAAGREHNPWCVDCKFEGNGVFLHEGQCSLMPGWEILDGDKASCKPDCPKPCKDVICGGICIEANAKFYFDGLGLRRSTAVLPLDSGCLADSSTAFTEKVECSYQSYASGETTAELKCDGKFSATNQSPPMYWECEEKNVDCPDDGPKLRIKKTCVMERR